MNDPWEGPGGETERGHEVARPARETGPVVPVILSGGAGARLWPLSREYRPKPLIDLPGHSETLFQATLRRLRALDDGEMPLEAPIVVCNAAHRFPTAQQLAATGTAPGAVLLEPVGRNTAPAAAAAAFEALARYSGRADPVLLVLPADHAIDDEARFAAAVRAAVREARAGRLAAFGVAADRPETGYGYIVPGGPTGGGGVRVVEAFTEKPDAARAAALIEAGALWNSGIFTFGATRYLQELGRFAPAVREAAQAAHDRAAQDLGFLRLEAAAFATAPAVSVDCAVMERTADAVMVPLDAGWSDIGSWTAVANRLARDPNGNAVEGDALLVNSRDSCIVAAGGRLVAAVGLEGCIVVDAEDAVLVAAGHAAQDVSWAVERLEAEGRREARTDRRVWRPWGCYTVVAGGPGFQVKRIAVDPGQSLSLQMHRRRTEHWTVVRGEALVIIDDKQVILRANQSVEIPRWATHRLENPGSELLEVIEVQCGSYLGEDDIVRFEDAYGRIDASG